MIQENVGGALGGAISVILGAALYMKRMKPTFALDEKVVATVAADNGIIDRLERESKRLSEQNDKLANSLNAFQIQLLTFQTENQKLSFENTALKEENFSLREEIVELRSEVNALGKELLRIQQNIPNCYTCPNNQK